MRPTDVCHPYDLRAPASRAFPASSPDFHRVDTPSSLRLGAVISGGPKGSRPSRPLRRIVPHTTPTLFAFQCLPRAFCLTAFRTRAWAFSSHGAKTNRASDIPVASPRSSPLCASLSCVLLRASSCWAFTRSVDDGEAAKIAFHTRPWRRVLSTTRDAFPRWGPFVGSGGLYSPGPATSAWPFDLTAKTARWRSHVTVGLGRFTPVFVRCARPVAVPSLDAFIDGFTRRRSLRARPLFTRPCPLFLRARLPSVFGTRRRLPTSATAFFRHAGNQTRALVSS